MDSGAEAYARFLAGERDALGVLIAQYREGLILYLSSIVGNLWTAEELAEDTFVRLATRRPRDRGKSSFKTWLYTIGRNLAIDWLRKNRSALSVPLEDAEQYAADTESIEQSYLRRERDRTLHSAMQQLKAEYRQVLWLVYFDGLPLRDAAAVMHKSVHSTEMLVSRARNALRTILEKEGFDYEIE